MPSCAGSSERAFRRILLVLSALAALALASHFGLIFWIQRSITQVEAIVAVHSRMLADGRGLYYQLNDYPYTISPYGPLGYGANALLYLLGLPALQGGRLLSFASLIGVVVVCWRLLWLYTGDRWASWAGALLVASTANLSQWGTVGQSDMPALFFSVAAFYSYSRYRLSKRPGALIAAGVFIALSIFTKQSFLAAGAAIVILLFLKDRRAALRFTLALGVIGVGLALALNAATGGGYFDNAIFANLNPFSAEKLGKQTQYFVLAGAGLLALVIPGLPRTLREPHPFFVYLGTSFAVLAMTAPKVGSDLNYQIETMTVLGLCAGWSLHRLNFFALLFQGDKSWVTLLQLPLLLHVVLNLLISGNVMLGRAVRETGRREEVTALRPYLAEGRGRALSVQIDAMLAVRGSIEVEPLIYRLLVEEGLVDPEPVRRDLAEKRFSTVVLYDDVFNANPDLEKAEVPSLPAEQIEEIRKNYRLVEHVSGPLLAGNYVYEPTP